MVRYGIVGFGSHGVKRLVPGFAGAKNSKLAGIWRRDIQKAKSQAAEFGIDCAFMSAEDLCDSSAVDAVIVTSPDALHMQDTLLAISHGKPVLCEKPAAMNAEQLSRMLACARTANVQFGIAQNFRYNRSVNLIRNWIEDGRIGTPVFAAAHFCFHAENSPRKWIYDPGLACGGPIGDVGIHCMDALRYVLSDDISAVMAMARHDRSSRAVESSAALAMEFSRGALGSTFVSFRANYHSWVEVIGEEAIAQSDDCLTVDHPVEVVLRKHGEIVDLRRVANEDSYSLMLDSFSDAVEGRGKYAAPGNDAMNNQSALDAAYASVQSGKREVVNLRRRQSE